MLNTTIVTSENYVSCIDPESKVRKNAYVSINEIEIRHSDFQFFKVSFSKF